MMVLVASAIGTDVGFAVVVDDVRSSMQTIRAKVY